MNTADTLDRAVTLDTAVRHAPARIVLRDGRQLTGILSAYGRISITLRPDATTKLLLQSTWKTQSYSPHAIAAIYQA